VLYTAIDPAVPHFLKGDPARLQQVLNNLLSNALKFTEEGSVSIRISGKGGNSDIFNLSIEVIDTGIGISPNKQKSIFSKFSQADVSTARKYGGTGLGLSIVQNLVELMGGHITLRSEAGRGSTFTVSLPVLMGREENAIVLDVMPATGLSANINTQARVMVVDDHSVNLLFMRTLLKNLRFEHFDEAANG
jgi:signal transduction histidine kinase